MNEDKECFDWWHIRHLNLMRKGPQPIKYFAKQMIAGLDHEVVEFWTSDIVPFSSKEFLYFQEASESKFTLKRVCDMIITNKWVSCILKILC